MADNQGTGGTRPFRFGVVAPLTTALPGVARPGAPDRRRRLLYASDAGRAAMAACAWTHVGCRGDSHRPAGGDVVYAAPLRMAWSMAWEAHSLSVVTEGRFEMGIGTGRPGIEDELRGLGLPVATPGERLSQVRDAVTSLRELDGPALHMPVVMAVRGPKALGAGGGTGGYRHVRSRPCGLPGRDCAAARRTSVRSGTSSLRATYRWSVTLSRRS